MALGLPAASSSKPTFSQLSLSKKGQNKVKQMQIHTGTLMIMCYEYPSVKDTTLRMCHMCERTSSTDGRQSWIRDGIDTASITQLWQISRLVHSKSGPLLQIHPNEHQGLDQYANVSCYLLSPALVQWAFSQERPRLLQNYQQSSSTRKQCLEYHEYMHGVIGFLPCVGSMWGGGGDINIRITT